MLVRKLSVISSVDPPPTSTTTVPCSSGPTPRKVIAASSSPVSSRVAKPYDHSISPRNASPFSASRTALVATASVRSAPSPSSSRRYSVSTFRTRAIGNGEEAAARVDTLAEPGDARSAHELLDAAVFDVGDEQAGGVRAEVDRADARHLLGTAPRRRSRAALASAAAARSRASCASDVCRCSVGLREPLPLRVERCGARLGGRRGAGDTLERRLGCA